jgi:hypothetical protein
MANDRRRSCRRGAALALLAALAASAVLSACDMFKPVGEGEYKFNKDGPADYFREGFEKNDGASSTEHFISRLGYDEHHLPSVSQTWASEGSWSMRIPRQGTLTFTFSPKERGRLSFKYASASPTYFNIQANNYTDGHADSASETTEADYKTGTASVFVYPGETLVTIWLTSGPIFFDEINFTPSLIGASPEDGGVFTVPPALDWGDTENGAPYHLQVSDRQDFATTIIDAAGIQESRYDLAGLSAGKCYYWRLLTANAEPTGEWTTPFHFMLAAPPNDDSFETDLQGTAARNAWYAAGRLMPTVISTDSFTGSKSLKLVQTDDITGDSAEDVFAELVITLDSPKVLRYSYKVESPKTGVSAPTYLLFYRYTLTNGSWTSGTDYPMSHTSGTWAQAVELIPAGTHRIRWYFKRTADNINSGSFALLDDLRFEDPQPLAADGFETLDAAGRTAQAWGFQGWYASSLSQTGGVGGSRGLQLSASGIMMNDWNQKYSAITLLTDTGTEPVILSCKTNGNQDALTTSLSSLPHIYRGSGWGERFFTIPGNGVQALQFCNRFTDQSLTLDDFRIIPYTKLTAAGLSEGFESGSLGGQYYSDEYLPPALETANPHSGSYCLKLAKNAGKTSSFISFPISTNKAIEISLWLRVEGTSVRDDQVTLGRGTYFNYGMTDISSTWTKYTFSYSRNYDIAYPLTLFFHYLTDTGMTVYVDDITVTPTD